jgi:ribosome-binding protein aMBF1 (putative translation factor)
MLPRPSEGAPSGATRGPEVGHGSTSDWTLSADSARQVRETIATNVRRERTSARLSQRALAQESQVGEDTIVRLEKGQQEPRIVTLVAFSFALDVPLSALLLDLPTSRR